MAIFKLHCLNPDNFDDKTDVKIFYYDNMKSILTDENGVDVIEPLPKPDKKTNYKTVKSYLSDKDNPIGKSKNIKILKIQLGLSCNYECTYCSQRFVPHADETNPDDIEPWLEKLPTWFDGGPDGNGEGVKIEFWGGEPFVYWKTFKPLAERLWMMYPKIRMSVVTNATLLDEEKVEWLDLLGFGVGISHDGPGYHVRGLDPLDDPEKFHWIKTLYERLAPKGRISINAMMNNQNTSRAAIQDFFIKKFGYPVRIGEGGFIDPYDEGGVSACFQEPAEHIEFRNNALAEVRKSQLLGFSIVEKIDKFVDGLLYKRPAESLGQKCGMDSPGNISVDLRGNVLTCQNLSEVSISGNGESHKIGHVDDFNNIKLKTITQWSKREECPKCPVLHVCQGSCMFLHGDLWELGCDASFTDAIPWFAAGIEALTSYTPYYIEGPQREDRRDIFGLVNGIPEKKQKKFPIPVVSA